MSSKQRPNIFGFWNGIYDGLYMGVAIAESGTVLAINNVYAMSELEASLGMDGVSTEMHVIYDEFYPGGWNYEFVHPLRYPNHKQLQLAIALAERKKKTGEVWRYFQKARREFWNKTGIAI